MSMEGGFYKADSGFCWPQAWVTLSMGLRFLPHCSRGLEKQPPKVLVAAAPGNRNRARQLDCC